MKPDGLGSSRGSGCGAGDWWKGLQNCLPAGKEGKPGGFCLQLLVHRLLPWQVYTGVKGVFQASPKALLA